MNYRFRSQLWRYQGKAAWHFVTLPADVSDEVAEAAIDAERGFGSVRVSVTVGSTTWATSLFPDQGAGSYVLPVKKQVRSDEGIEEGDELDVSLELIGE